MIKAIIVDIDGTLAHMGDRSPYDPTKYHEDTVHAVIADIVVVYRSHGYEIIVCSGRDDDYYDTTAKWLTNNKIPFDVLLMREAGDKREDSIIKKELYLRFIKPKYDVHFVLDDRDRVVKMWREQGLKCLQVAEGDF